MKLMNRKNYFLFVLLGTGFLIGIIFENIIAKNQEISVQMFQNYFLKQYSSAEIRLEEYIWYVMKIRVIPFVILCILGCFRWKKLLAVLCLIWTGFLSGILMTAAVIQLGIKGVVICIIGIFPHFLFYGIVYGILFVYLFSYPHNKWKYQKTIVVSIMMLIGIITETYLNTYFLKWFIKIL